MKVLVDANVFLDVALDRAEFVADSKGVLKWCQSTPGAAAIAWHSISNIYYVLSGARSDDVARRFISEMIAFGKVVGGDTGAVRQALNLKINDFEDALQVAAGFAAHAEWVVTRNISDYRNSPIPAITPRDFVRRFLTT